MKDSDFNFKLFVLLELNLKHKIHIIFKYYKHLIVNTSYLITYYITKCTALNKFNS